MPSTHIRALRPHRSDRRQIRSSPAVLISHVTQKHDNPFPGSLEVRVRADAERSGRAGALGKQVAALAGTWWGGELAVMFEGRTGLQFLPAGHVALLLAGGMAVGAAGGSRRRYAAS
jgi:hypothetical protein